MAKRNREIIEITDPLQKKSTKCRRGRNLMKKCYELSVLCGLKVNLIIFNPKNKKIQEYSSSADFTHEKVHDIMKHYPSDLYTNEM